MATPSKIVEEVLANKWGTGETRKQKLKDAGYSWIEIQSLINIQYGGRPVKASDEEIAQEVLENRWGTGTDRKERITAAGFNYANIQRIVNQLVAQGNTSSSSSASTIPPSPSSNLSNNKKIPIATKIQSKGIDISAWQGTVDFNKVKKAGIQFVILREGYSTVADNHFFEYVRGAKAAGLAIPAVYHFCYATNEAGAIVEAQSCIANVNKAGLPKNTILFFDFEYDTVNNARKKGVNLGRTQCIAFSKAFCNTILAQGFNTGIYCNLDYYNNMYDQATLNSYNLWLAQYTSGAPKVKSIFHQYSDKGNVSGIYGNVDLDNCYIAPVSVPVQEETKPSTPSNIAPALNTDFSKYYNKISNCGKDENGGAVGGRAGDQSGKEWWIINWYNQGWKCILRHPDAKVREYIATLGIQAAQNDNVGYDQSENRTYWNQLQNVGYWPKNITVPCEADCSAGVIANVKAVGHLLNIDALKNINATYTGNMRAAFREAGFMVLTEGKYLGSANYLLPGDIILNDSQHTATNLGYGKNAEIPSTNISVPTEKNDGEHKVTATMLNVRNFPSTQSKIVGQLVKGTAIDIKQTIKNEDGSVWYQIDQGYVAAQYIS